MDALEAIRQRFSARAYLSRPVGRELVESVLDTARWAPSAVNIQPWKVIALTGETKQKLSHALLAAKRSGVKEEPDFQYYPSKWEEPYATRRKESGLALYKALGIGKDDHEKRMEAWLRNYSFFGAPVGLLFFIDKGLERGSWLDFGMFMQNVMISAKAHGLDTCPQASFAEFPSTIRKTLDIPETLSLACGMSLGYADMTAAVNNYRTKREPVESFMTWME
ncbi:MAG: nitroreductase [Nitrospinae bacterium]|nr:nitroreductase [Nitrospinota bacterium]